jgi:hypothetical protein
LGHIEPIDAATFEEQKKKEAEEIERAYREAVKRTGHEQPAQKTDRYDPWRTAH